MKITKIIPICYLCHEWFIPEDPIEFDHVIPKSIFPDSPVLPTHSWCNQEHRDYPLLNPPTLEERSKRISQSTREGLARAKANGKQIGARKILTEEQEEDARLLYSQGMKPVDIAIKMNVSRATIYRALDIGCRCIKKR